MARLSDTIEEFIKSMLEEADTIELQRNELAQYFGCAPSQINYVLTTRFSLNRGYTIQSRKGGGGYIRVIRITGEQDKLLTYIITERIGTEISENGAMAIIGGILENGMVTDSEAQIMLAAVSNRALTTPVQLRDTTRAGVLREMLLAIINNRGSE